MDISVSDKCKCQCQSFRRFVHNNRNNTNIGSSINLKPSPNLSLLYNQLDHLSSDWIKKIMALHAGQKLVSLLFSTELVNVLWPFQVLGSIKMQWLKFPWFLK